jgi:ribosomal protein L21E
MPHFKPGDRVRLVTRAQTEEDMKSGLYYEHFGGMTGIVQKIYGPQEIAVEIEPESLPQEIRQRHENVRDQMKTKWLEGLSEEGRSRLSEREKDFHLRYIILVSAADLQKTSSQAASSDSICQEPSPTRKTTADLEAAEEAELRRRSHRVEEGKRA